MSAAARFQSLPKCGRGRPTSEETRALRRAKEDAARARRWADADAAREAAAPAPSNAERAEPPAAFRWAVEGRQAVLNVERHAGLLDLRGDEDERPPWLPRPRWEPARPAVDEAEARRRRVRRYVAEWRAWRRGRRAVA